MSSAKARTPINSFSTLTPSYLSSNSLMIYLMSGLNKIGEVLAPCLTPFSFSIGGYYS